MGFTEPRRTRKYFGSLLFGQHKQGKLVFVGRAGTGFNEKTLSDVFMKMKPYIQKRTRIDSDPQKITADKIVTWIKPVLMAALRFTEWTKDGSMRHPVFMGLRHDKTGIHVNMEASVPAAKVLVEAKNVSAQKHIDEFVFSNPDKIFFPKHKLTKSDLVSYYERIVPTILPYLMGRPESLSRHPNGVGGKSVFLKNIEFKTPEFVVTYLHFSASTQADVNYLVCNNKETLLYLASLGCIEINPWNSRLPNLDNPDFYIIDLDSSDKNTFEEVIRVAQEAKKVLDMACEKSYIKTSEKSGIHICVPLGAKYTYSEVWSFAELMVRIINKRLPLLTSIERSPAKRNNKFNLDYLQNREGQTIAAPYSLRPTEEATVSTPLRWAEVKKGLTPKQFTYKTIFPRL